MKNKIFMILFILIFSLIFVGQVQARAEFDVNAQQPSKFEWGETKQVSITVRCDNSVQTCRCSAYWDGVWSSLFLVNAQSSTTKYVSVIAPSSGQGSESYNYRVDCYEYWDPDYYSDNAPFTVNYPTDVQWAQYQVEQEAIRQAESAKTDANNAISSANSDVNSAESRINEASNTGADVSLATQSLNAAKSYLTQAENSFSSGNSAFSSQDYSSAKTSYNDAKNKANSAQNSAAQAKSTVDQIMESYNKEKTEADDKVSEANSAIDTAKQRIQDADEVIADATVIGLDTAQSKADIATARSKLKTAEDYFSEASNMFSIDRFENAKNKAQSAIGLADEAESLATTAYNRLHERLTVSGESSKAILNANSEVSQMNEILTKMDYIVRSTEKWGVDLTETKSVVEDAKTNVDSAEDLLSQSKNRQASGTFNEAVNYANQARDKAASSKNRLDTMTHTISLSTQDALEKAYNEIQNLISTAEAEVKSAQGTYGATVNLIIDAQNDLTEAKNYLAQIETHIEEVKSASGLMSLLEEAEISFKAIDLAQEKVESTIANAKSAKLGLAKKIGIGAAIVAGIVGGGFLYYRQRKKKKSEKGRKKKRKR